MQDVVECMHRLTPIRRWTRAETFHQSVVQAPSIVLTYSLFMSGVELFDRLRTANAIARKEKGLSVSVLTFMLDANHSKSSLLVGSA